MRNHNHNPITAPPVALATLALLAILALAPAPAHATGDQNEAFCPQASEESPGFRSFLPDCGAFELVTPPYSSGAPPLALKETVSISADGEHVIGIAFGGFCGTENLEENEQQYGALYEFSRTPDGWSCEALDPPASLFPRRRFEFASADLSRSLWNLQIPAHSGEEVSILEGSYDGYTLGVREAAGGGKGRFTLLGPVVAPGHGHNIDSVQHSEQAYYVTGASADLTHVLLSVVAEHKQLWPGDTTLEGERLREYEGDDRSSLYEYRLGGSDEPVLVGVRNSGPLHGSPHINEQADLISQCGIGANAISASGEVVYFTASAANQGPEAKHCNAQGEGTGPAVNELYARVGGSQTVDISEPSTGPGGDCESCDESEPKAAVFQAASEDGSKMFFTTEQELLAGAKGNSLYEYDFDAASGRRVSLLAAEVTDVTATSRSGARVYFESGAVLSAAANGHGETVNGNGEPAELEQANLYVYGTETGDTAFVAQAVEREETTRDGQFLAFSSARRLKGTNDTSEAGQLFEYDAETGTVLRVSVGQKSATGYECPATKAFEEGYDCDGNTTIGEDEPKMASRLGVAGPSAATSGLSLSEGGVVVFSSELALTPQALSGEPSAYAGRTENVYEYRANNVYLISPADEAAPLVRQQRVLGVDESGRDVFFGTTDSLVPQDTDTQYSWYDAREDGGFPAPVAAPGCMGEACEGPVSPTPVLAAPSSTTLTGPGNLAPADTPPLVTVNPKPKTAAQIKAEKLAKALKACRAKRGKRKRASCEKSAREKYGSSIAKNSTPRSK